MKSTIITLLLTLTFIFGITACENEGSAEKAGKQIDNALEQAKEKFEEATE